MGDACGTLFNIIFQAKWYTFILELTDKKQPVFILHKSAIDNALIERALAGDKVADLTLRELFEKLSGIKELAEKSFGIVTEDGRKDSSIIG